jgi:hypothetical protein
MCLTYCFSYSITRAETFTHSFTHSPRRNLRNKITYTRVVYKNIYIQTNECTLEEKNYTFFYASTGALCAYYTLIQTKRITRVVMRIIRMNKCATHYLHLRIPPSALNKHLYIISSSPDRDFSPWCVFHTEWIFCSCGYRGL